MLLVKISKLKIYQVKTGAFKTHIETMLLVRHTREGKIYPIFHKIKQNQLIFGVSETKMAVLKPFQMLISNKNMKTTSGLHILDSKQLQLLGRY